MKNGWHYDGDGQRVMQPLNYRVTGGVIQKGMKAVLEERGLYRAGMKKDDCYKVL